MKNVTGYDLVKLLAGSWGTLGVLTELAFRVLPVPEARATLRLPNVTVEEAPACLARALGSPFEVTGAAWRDGQGALIRIEGLSRQIAYRGAELRRLLGQGGAEVLLEADPAASDQIWRDLRDLAPFVGQPGDLWRISVPPSQAPALLRVLGAEAVMLDWGGGLIWARMAPGTDLRGRIGSLAGHATLMR
ncbi:glycolate oxidase subunit GlcE, partial [Thioclava sp. BHET1]